MARYSVEDVSRSLRRIMALANCAIGVLFVFTPFGRRLIEWVGAPSWFVPVLGAGGLFVGVGLLIEIYWTRGKCVENDGEYTDSLAVAIAKALDNWPFWVGGTIGVAIVSAIGLYQGWIILYIWPES